MDTVNAHPYGMKSHKFRSPAIGFAPAELVDMGAGAFTGYKDNKTTERDRLKTKLREAAVTGAPSSVDYTKYAVLWTQVDGPKKLSINNNVSGFYKYKDIDNPAILTPTIANLVSGSYKFEVYAVRMNGKDSYCDFTDEITVDIHIPSMAAIEAKYQGIGDWTLDRTAMCQDNIDLQWMSATGITYSPSSTLPDGSKLAPGEIKGVEKGVEYSIIRTTNDDTGGNSITYTKSGFTAGNPGTTGFHIANLPYNATNFELFNCIDFVDPQGNAQKCATSDTITIFNNSVIADADVRIPNTTDEGKWKKQEVNICTNQYELHGNNPESDFDNNKSIEEYRPHGLWGFDDKDFKGFVYGRPMPSIANVSSYQTMATNLLPSDNHQRANAFIWCVYKSILPPDCDLINRKTVDWTGGSDKWYPLRFLCAQNTSYSDYYNSDGKKHIYFYYAEDNATTNRLEPLTDGDKFFQIKFTDPDDGKVKYAFLKDDYDRTSVTCTDDKTTLKVMLVKDEKDDGEEFCIDEKSITDYVPENGKILMPYDKLQHQKWGEAGKSCFANDAVSTYTGNDKCVAYYSMEDIEAAEESIAQRMRVQNFLYYMRNSCGGTGYGRTNWNYYVTLKKDDPNNIYLWSDRSTHGNTYGYLTYSCNDGTTNAQMNVIEENDNTFRSYIPGATKEFPSFFKGAAVLISPNENDPRFNIEHQYLKANFSVQGRKNNRNITCWPTQFDGGGNNAPPQGWKGGYFGDGGNACPQCSQAYDDSNRDEANWAVIKECISRDDHYNGSCADRNTPSCGLCGFGGNINFFTWAMWGYGNPGVIPVEVLKHTDDGDFGWFMNHLDPNDVPPYIHVTHSDGVMTAGNPLNPDFTNFAALKGTRIVQDSWPDNNDRAIRTNVPVLPGWDYAYHVVNMKFDNEAFARYMDKLNSDIARQGVKERDPIVAKAQTVDELKEEADNASKHYWCVDRDTVFIYDNTITSMEIKPNFIVCDDKAQLIGENPGVAAEANASGYWTIKTNTQSVKFDTEEESTNNVANVHGLPAGETQFNWHITRWECEFDKDMFVYYNAVESNPGAEIYTCDDKAQLEAVQPSVGEGHWEFTQATPPGVQYGDDGTGPATDQDAAKKNNKAWVHYLQQGDNPFTWVVENPMPPSTTETYTDQNGVQHTYEVLEQINGHDYYIQESCPVGKETKVHDLRPDDAIIETGDKVGP